MRRVALERFGGPEVLRLVEEQTPAPGPDEALVQVRAAGVNFADVLQRRGVYPLPIERPTTLGGEIAGVVRAVGTGVSNVRPGDRVAALLPNGGYADHAVVRAERLVPLPEGIGFEQATALLVQGLTAVGLVEQVDPPLRGKTVFVSAAAGGVGGVLVQLLKAEGAFVIGGVGSAAKEALVGRHVDWVARYDRPDWSRELREQLGSRQIDVVFDAVGGDVYRELMALLGTGGTCVCYGAAGGELVGAPPEIMGPMIFRSQRLVGFALPSLLEGKPGWMAGALRRLFAMALAGRLHVHLHPPFSLARASEAHAALESRGTLGKVVIIMDDP
jgi:NADPH2:quinone reductase